MGARHKCSPGRRRYYGSTIFNGLGTVNIFKNLATREECLRPGCRFSVENRVM